MTYPSGSDSGHPAGPVSGAAAAARFAGVLVDCRDAVLKYCDAHLGDFFEQAGTALLEFAERAESNAVQGRFFEAMAHLQRQRQGLLQQFRQEIAYGFDHLGSLEAPSSELPEDSSELSLIDPEEMEEAVATENIIIKTNASCFPELYALSQRLAVVNGGIKLKDYQLPGGPHQLVSAFRRAVQVLDVEVKIKIVLYALFERVVMRPAPDLYRHLNGLLRAEGILPQIRPIAVRKQSRGAGKGADQRRRPAARAAVSRAGGRPAGADDTGGEAVGEFGGESGGDTAGGAGHGGVGGGPPAAAGGDGADTGAAADDAPAEDAERSLGAELFDSILELMSKRQGATARMQARGQRPLARDQVVAVFERLPAPRQVPPPGSGLALAGVPQVEVDQQFVGRVKQALSEQREQLVAAIDRDKLAPVDADLIDLIGLLFEYMLNDPVLPNAAKALISHLHTPYLKVALIDHQLLVDAAHPARRLLDLMVEAGSLWVEESNPSRGIFPYIQRVVDRVLQEFSDDVGLFDELLTYFEQGVEEQRRRTDTMEQRTQEAARGRERLQLAKQRAATEVRGLIGRHPLPEAVLAFLHRNWLDVLAFILLRNPQAEASPAWRAAVASAEQLVGLFDLGLDATALTQCLEQLPQLRQRLGEGVRAMGSYNHAVLDAVNEVLADPLPWRERLRAAEGSALPDLSDYSGGARSGPLRGPGDDPDTEELTEEERAMIQRLRKTRFGTWFEFSSSATEPPRRIKLSWMSLLTSTCMFVDRSGMQAEIKTLRELAEEMLAGRARVIPRPEHPFIERALVSIRKVLTQEEGSNGPGSGGSGSGPGNGPALPSLRL